MNMANDREAKLGELIKSARLRKNMTQEEVAARVGVTVPTISRLESGKNSSLTTFLKVAEILGEGKWIDSFAPEVGVSPLSMKKTGKTRERASKKTK